MKMSDLTVEVRDRTLKRMGAIHPRDLRLRADLVFNNVGTWELTLPAEHPMATHLRVEGSGIVVTGPNDVVLFSGPMVSPKERKTGDDPQGTVIFSGLTDDVVLADALAWPHPGREANDQARANDTRSAAAETLLHAYVSVNIGRSATAPRKSPYLTHGPDLGRGTVLKKAPRFQNLGELLAEIALTDGLGFQVVQRGNALVFETYQVRDVSKTVRLDMANGTLASNEIEVAAPGVTTTIVAGQGEGVKRQIIEMTRAADTAATALWGRRIERFVDQRQTDVTAELRQAGLELLISDGLTATTVRAVGGDDQAMAFPTDWGLGDQVAVVDGTAEIAATVTTATLVADSKGVRMGMAIGERSSTSEGARISSLERNAEVALPAYEPDLPWVAVAAVAPFTSNSVRVRRRNGIVQIQGSFNATASGSIPASTFTPLCYLPEGYRPEASILVPGSMTGANIPQFQINPSTGLLQFRVPTATNYTQSPNLSIAGTCW